MPDKREQLNDLIRPVAESMGCELWGIEFLNAPSRSTLRVFIEKSGGVDIADCERISRQLSSVFDVQDPISGEYVLEVSSPGLDRPLYTIDQYRQFIGEQLSVKLRIPFDGRRNFKGHLSGVENDEIILVSDGEEYILPHELVEKAKIIPTY